MRKYDFLEKMAHAELERVKKFIEDNGKSILTLHNYKFEDARLYDGSASMMDEYPFCFKKRESGVEFFSVWTNELFDTFQQFVEEDSPLTLAQMQKYVGLDGDFYFSPEKSSEATDLIHTLLDNYIGAMVLYKYSHLNNTIALGHEVDYYSSEELNNYYNDLCFIIFKFYDVATEYLKPFIKAAERWESWKADQVDLYKQFLEDHEESFEFDAELEAEKERKAKDVLKKLNLSEDELSTLADYFSRKDA